ncbi:dynamin family protein [Frankia sp. Cr1]|uniref:dynamin family protein n=1 Tax=Frankia sp. Cr1 TaxID=3073931 RepID=UPI002AD2F2EE|nr:dynamin family protein [Frankia sp. Cr1]
MNFSEHIQWADATSTHLGLDTASVGPLRDQTARLRRRLADHNLYIAVLGEFNSGKSTFINTVLRHRLLPTASVVTTGTATELRYGPSVDVAFCPRGSNRMFSFSAGLPRQAGDEFERQWRRITGRTVAPRTVSEAVALLVTDPHTTANVGKVSISHPSALLADQVVLVDTPGINASAEHEDVVDRVLSQTADLAVVLVPSNAPVSQVLSNFLAGTMRRHRDRCVFGVTKLEQVPGSQRPRLLEVVRKRLELAGISAPRVYPCGGGSVLEILTEDDGDGDARQLADEFLAFEGELTSLARRASILAISTTTAHIVADLLDEVTICVAQHRARLLSAERELDSLRVRDLESFLAEARTTIAIDLQAVARAQWAGAETRAVQVRTELLAELAGEVNGCANLDALQVLVRERTPELVRARLQDWFTDSRDALVCSLSMSCDRTLTDVQNSFQDEYRRLAGLAGQTATALVFPPTPDTPVPQSVDIDFSAVQATVAEHLRTENRLMGGGAVAGAAIGTLFFPGVGTVLGGLLGGILGTAASDGQLAQAREKLDEPLRQAVTLAFDQTHARLATATHEAVDAQNWRCEKALDALRKGAGGPVQDLLESERVGRAELRRQLTQVTEVESECTQRVALLRARQEQLRTALEGLR